MYGDELEKFYEREASKHTRNTRRIIVAIVAGGIAAIVTLLAVL